jgi:hypothetical protein
MLVLVVEDAEYIGFATDLAVFDVLLALAGRDVDSGLVPLAATGALKP